MDKREFLLLEKKANIIKGIANPYRIAILNALKDAGEEGKTLKELMEIIGGETSNLSRHLSIMRKEGILDTYKKGLLIYYRVKYSEIYSILDIIDKILKKMISELENISQVL